MPDLLPWPSCGGDRRSGMFSGLSRAQGWVVEMVHTRVSTVPAVPGRWASGWDCARKVLVLGMSLPGTSMGGQDEPSGGRIAGCGRAGRGSWIGGVSGVWMMPGGLCAHQREGEVHRGSEVGRNDPGRHSLIGGGRPGRWDWVTGGECHSCRQMEVSASTSIPWPSDPSGGTGEPLSHLLRSPASSSSSSKWAAGKRCSE